MSGFIAGTAIAYGAGATTLTGLATGAMIGGAVGGSVSASKAASSQARAASEAAQTQSEAAVRVAEIEAQAAREAADLQAQAFRDAAAEQERGIFAAGGITQGTPQTVEDLYASILQRDATAADLAFYRDRFGPTKEAETQLAASQQQEIAAQTIYNNLAREFEETGSEQSGEALERARVQLQAQQAQAQQAKSNYDEQARIDPQEIIEFRAAAAPEITRRATDPEGYAQDLARQGLRGDVLGPGIVGAGEFQASAIEKAAKLQADAQKEAQRLQELEAASTYTTQENLLSPFSDAGVNALTRLGTGFATGGEFTKPFTEALLTTDPGYAFRLSEGQKALERQAAARGGLISGGALKAATRFGQEMGSQEFQRAFDRYYAERQAQIDPLFRMSDIGLAAAGDLARFEGVRGANVANYIGEGKIGEAQSRAQGIVGAGAVRSSSYLDDLQARAQTQRDLATARASGYTGPAQFQASGILGASRATAGGLQGAATATSQGLLQASQARAAGQMGAQNTLISGLGGAYNLYQQNKLLEELSRRPGTMYLGGG